MYTSDTESNGSFYLLWMEFVPYFSEEKENAKGESWCKFEESQLSQTFRLLFQMGDEFSDWEGVYYDFEVCELEDHDDDADTDQVCSSNQLPSPICEACEGDHCPDYC